MIPKIIHYCWFGSGPKPDSFIKYLATWKRCLPDYEIREWNEHYFDLAQYTYSREAYIMGSYAHVSDVCRMHVLYYYGGIYLDTDVEVIKSFDPFLKFRSFLGAETWNLGTGVIGAEAGEKWVYKFLQYYSRTHFIDILGHCVRTPNTKILQHKILPTLPAKFWPAIFPYDFFACKSWEDGALHTSESSVSIHHYAASWRRKDSFFKKLALRVKGFRVRFICRKRVKE